MQSFEHEIESICTIMSIRGCNVLKNIKLNCYLQSFQKIRKYCVCKIDELLKMSLALKNWRKLLKFLNRTWPTNSDKFTPWTISGGPSFSPIVSMYKDWKSCGHRFSQWTYLSCIDRQTGLLVSPPLCQTPVIQWNVMPR